MRVAPPYNAEAEHAALGGALVAGGVPVGLLLEHFAPQDCTPESGEIYEAMIALDKKGAPVKPTALNEELLRRGRIEDPGLIVHTLLAAASTQSDTLYYAKQVGELARKRRALEAVPLIHQYAMNGKDREHLREIGHQLIDLAGEGDQDVGFEPLDLAELIANPPPPLRYLFAPYMPERRRVWAFGAASSGKSMWAAWLASRLTREGREVLYVSQENPLDEEVRRFHRLRPDPARLRLLHDAGVDLAQPGHVEALVELARGTVLVVIDTLTACWSGDENDNPTIAALDRNALMPLVRETGASVLVLHHSGHPQAFVKRTGVNAGRGASSMGQKADGSLTFDARGRNEVVLGCPKQRGAVEPPPRLLRIVDTDDGGLDIETVGDDEDVKVAAVAEAMVEAIHDAGSLHTRALHEAVKAHGGKDAQVAAMRLLESEDPPRVEVAQESIETGGRRRSAKVWRPAGDRLL